MRASVIIPTYNRADILPYCLKHILDQTVDDYEVIVVDDSSEDLTEKLKILAKVKYIRLESRKGRPWDVRQVGVKSASGDIIIFIDSDVLVDKRFVEDHLFLHAKSEKLVVQGVVRHIRTPEDFGKKTLRIDGICVHGLIPQSCSLSREWLIKAGDFNDVDYGLIEHAVCSKLYQKLASMGLKMIFAFRRCICYHVDGYQTKKRLADLFSKFEERGKSSIRMHQEKVVRAKVLFVSYILQTHRWAGKEATLSLLKKSIDSPLFFAFPVLKEVMKYHYRASGIKEVRKLTGIERALKQVQGKR